MPYKNKEKQKEFMHNYYLEHKESYLISQIKYRKTEKYRIQNKKNRLKYVERNSKKTHARDKMYYLIRKKYIKKDICAICGIENAEIHHEDYNYPFHIMWLCSKHHNMATNNQRVIERG